MGWCVTSGRAAALATRPALRRNTLSFSFVSGRIWPWSVSAWLGLASAFAQQARPWTAPPLVRNLKRRARSWMQRPLSGRHASDGGKSAQPEGSSQTDVLGRSAPNPLARSLRCNLFSRGRFDLMQIADVETRRGIVMESVAICRRRALRRREEAHRASPGNSARD